MAQHIKVRSYHHWQKHHTIIFSNKKTDIYFWLSIAEYLIAEMYNNG